MQYHVPLNDSQLPIKQTNKRHRKENTINRETSKLIKRIIYIYIYPKFNAFRQCNIWLLNVKYDCH